jgi:fluoride ion exporter CrcB/FEX
MTVTLVNDPKRKTQFGLLEQCSWIVIFSILGTFTRLALVELNDYSGYLVPPLLWAQFVGCAVMGFLTHEKVLFPDGGRNEGLYEGLATGYCGSVTTFSGWMLECFQALSDYGTSAEIAGHSSGYNVVGLIAQLVATLAFSFTGYKLGEHVSKLFEPFRHRNWAFPVSTSAHWSIIIILAAMLAQAAVIAVAAAVHNSYWRQRYTLALAFSPAGALTRAFLTKMLNGRSKTFLWGTFWANMLGTLLEAIFFLLQTVVDRDGYGIRCQVLQGLQDGYCGALTTISSLIAQLVVLSTRHAWRYGSVSVIFGLCLFIIIDGSAYWARGSSAGPARCTI